MHFILAEALVARGDLPGAAQEILTIRSNRYSTAVLPTYNTAEEALEDILAERRLELWLEGHRFIDVRRLGPITGRGYDRDPIDCVVSGVPSACDLPASNLGVMYLPIPLNELAGNNVIKQNTGF